MSELIAGIGEYKISKKPEDIIKTFALGSCIAVIIYDKVNKTGGMIHFALPDSSISADKAAVMPAYFADTGIPLLIDELLKSGLNIKSSWIKLAGGACVLDKSCTFDIGKRNLLAARKILWKYNLRIISEDVGDYIPRTVYLKLINGEVLISSAGKKWIL